MNEIGVFKTLVNSLFIEDCPGLNILSKVLAFEANSVKRLMKGNKLLQDQTRKHLI